MDVIIKEEKPDALINGYKNNSNIDEDEKQSEQNDPIPSPEIIDFSTPSSCPCCYLPPPITPFPPTKPQRGQSFAPPPWHHHHYSTQRLSPHHHRRRQNQPNGVGETRWPFVTRSTPAHQQIVTSPLSPVLKDCCDNRRGCYIQNPYHTAFGKYRL